MDSLDKRILQELQRDAGQSLKEIADKVGRSVTPTARRIRRLWDTHVIQRQVVLLDPKNVGLDITVFVFLKTSQHNDEWLETFAAGVKRIPEVVEFYRLSGDIDYLLKIVIPDLAHYDNVYKRLIKIAPLHDVSSCFAMERIMYTTELPLDACKL